MKKIIKLTESDLARIVKRVISEQALEKRISGPFKKDAVGYYVYQKGGRFYIYMTLSGETTPTLKKGTQWSNNSKGYSSATEAKAIIDKEIKRPKPSTSGYETDDSVTTSEEQKRPLKSLNESDDFKVNTPVRLKGTYDGETVTRDLTIYLKRKPKLVPQRSASGELDFEWSYQNVAPRTSDRLGSFNCGKEWVHLPSSEDVRDFYGKIYDDTALVMMRNYCKGGQNKQTDSTRGNKPVYYSPGFPSPKK